MNQIGDRLPVSGLLIVWAGLCGMLFENYCQYGLELGFDATQHIHFRNISDLKT